MAAMHHHLAFAFGILGWFGRALSLPLFPSHARERLLLLSLLGDGVLCSCGEHGSTGRSTISFAIVSPTGGFSIELPQNSAISSHSSARLPPP